VTDPELLAQFVVQVWHRADGLGGHLPFGDHDRKLAALGGDYLADDEDVVSQVDQFLVELQLLFADLVQREHRLKALARSGLKGREAELSGVALEHDSARQRNDIAGGVIDR